MSKLILPRTTALLLVIVVLIAACGNDSEPADPNQITVIATTTILGDVAGNIVGSDGTVDTLLPIGASPHDYQASAQQVASLQNADLVVANGLSLEEGLLDVLESAAADGANILAVGPQLDPIPFGDDSHDEDHDEGHDGSDPHVWLDPVRMGDAAQLIAEQLSTIDPAVDWKSRADEYSAQLAATDEQIRTILAVIPAENRKLVTNHGSLGYFAARYGFEIVGVIIPGGSTLADPSSAELTALVAEVERQGVPAIFGETTESSALAEAIAAEGGTTVEVVELYTGSLGDAGSGADTLIGLLLTNAERIAAALS